MNIGKEGKAFVAEPIPEPQTVEVEAAEQTDEREKVLVPVSETQVAEAVTA